MNHTKSLSKPDEVRKFENHGHSDVFRMSSGDIACATFEPGWSWTADSQVQSAGENSMANISNATGSGQGRAGQS